MSKTVRVHSCYDIAAGEPRPIICACMMKVDVYQARRMVCEGIAEWVTDGKRTYHNAVCFIGGMSRRTPRAATIDAKHIERAYVKGNIEEQDRINEYGNLSRQMLLDMIKYVPEWEFDEGRKNNLNVPVLQFPEDNRTPGGIDDRPNE